MPDTALPLEPPAVFKPSLLIWPLAVAALLLALIVVFQHRLLYFPARAAVEQMLSPGLTPWPQALSGQSWGACARGDYDGHYTNIAKSILANGMTHVIIRLGYEWDGNWFPWGTGLHETGDVNNRGK